MNEYLRISLVMFFAGIIYTILIEAWCTSKLSYEGLGFGIMMGLVLIPLGIVIQFKREMKTKQTNGDKK